MNRPDVLISYAQNHEDIVLARVLEPWKQIGHWIDVGAGHPTFDSVTRLFYDFGWTGINIEPLSDEYSLLSSERPNDINLNCAIGLQPGIATLYEGTAESRGTSTLIKENAIDAMTSRSTEVEVRTLSSIIDSAPWPIDFIKIDVEGMELDVIKSADWVSTGVALVVVESTLPNSVSPSFAEWEPILLAGGYSFRLFDGLNRYYLRNLPSFEGSTAMSGKWYPATVQDRFITHELLSVRDSAREVQHSFQEAKAWAESLRSHMTSMEEQHVRAVERMSQLENELRLSMRALADSEANRAHMQTVIEDLRGSLDACKKRIQTLIR